MKDVMIFPGSLISDLSKQWATYSYFTNKGYVAPTVFLVKGVPFPGNWPYYRTLTDAMNRLKYVFKVPGAINPAKVGDIALRNDGSAQTIGINCDFFAVTGNTTAIPVPYSLVSAAWKQSSDSLFGIFRFYKTNGAGPYYAILNPHYLGIASNVVSASGEKLAALDNLYREVEQIKANYNGLVTYLNELSKRKLSAVEQQIFNEGTQLRISMLAEIQQIKGVQIIYTTSGIGSVSDIGVIPVVPLIIILIVAATVVASAAVIVNEVQKSKRINSSYAFNQWATGKAQEIAAAIKSGNIDPATGNQIIKNLGAAQDTANQVAKDSGEKSDSIMSLLKWGIVGLVVLKGLDFIKPSRA